MSGTHPTAPGFDAGFVTTRWTAVLAAGRPGLPQADKALEELCRTYWYPLYAYARRRGRTKEDAEDLTQAFFERLLRKNDLEGLSPERGRFRAFLLASLKHFLADDWDRVGRQKRGAHAMHLSLDWRDADTRYQLDLRDDLSPDKLYDRAWAVALLERVVGQLRDACAADGKAGLFEKLKPLLMADRTVISYPQAAAALGLSEEAARVTVHRLRRRYRDLLREEIAQTLAEPAQVEEEMRALFAAFK